jgi:hypothetical protein
MSEYKFSCPNCDQHLSGTLAWAGRPLKCPTCQQDFTVPAPGAAAAAAMATVRAVASPPRAPIIRAADLPRAPGAAPAPGPAPTRAAGATGAAAGSTNGLAVASLACGILSFLGLSCLTGLPAVICGHLAMSRLKSGRATTGRGMAIAGLVLGYLALVLTVVVMIIWGLAFRQAMQAAQTSMQRNPPSRSVPVTPDRGEPARGPRGDRANRAPRATPATPVAAETKDPQVATDPATATIPNTPVAGNVGGKSFKCDKAEFSTFMKTLSLQEGTGVMADKSIKLFFFPEDGKPVLGRTWTAGANATPGANPHVHYASENMQGIESQNYALRVELGQPKNGKVTGKLYLELPASKGTKLAGTFEATVAN